MFKPNLVRFGFGAILVSLPLVLSPSAKADSQLDPPLALPQTAQNTHCVVSLDPAGPAATRSSATVRGCYHTFSGAISAATGARILLPPDATGKDLTEAMVEQAAGRGGSQSPHRRTTHRKRQPATRGMFRPMACGDWGSPNCPPNTCTDGGSSWTGACGGNIIGIDWINSNYGGSSLTWVTNDASGCYDGSVYRMWTEPSGWNDQISSAHAYMGCWHFDHYADAGYQGAVYTCPNADCPYFPELNDMTSSEKLRP